MRLVPVLGTLVILSASLNPCYVFIELIVFVFEGIDNCKLSTSLQVIAL